MLDRSCWTKTAVVKVEACFTQKIKPNNHQPILLLPETEICQKLGEGCSLCLFLDWSFQGLCKTSVIWFYFCSIAESQMRFYGFANLAGFSLLLLYLTWKEKDSELLVWNVFRYEITVKLRATRLLFIKNYSSHGKTWIICGVGCGQSQMWRIHLYHIFSISVSFPEVSVLISKCLGRLVSQGWRSSDVVTVASMWRGTAVLLGAP